MLHRLTCAICLLSITATSSECPAGQLPLINLLTSDVMFNFQYAPYLKRLSRDLTADVVSKSIDSDVDNCVHPTLVLCPRLTPDHIPVRLPLREKVLWQSALATANETFHTDVAELFSLVVNSGTDRDYNDASTRYRLMFGEESKNNNAGYFVFHAGFRPSSGMQPRYRGPDFNFHNAFRDRLVVPMHSDPYVMKWTKFWAKYSYSELTDKQFDDAVSHMYVSHSAKVCWSLLLQGRQNDTTILNTNAKPLEAHPSSDNVKRKTVWNERCIYKCSPLGVLDSALLCDNSVACKKSCIEDTRCQGFYLRNACLVPGCKRGYMVLNVPSATELANPVEDAYDSFLQIDRASAGVNMAFNEHGTFPIKKSVVPMHVYHRIDCEANDCTSNTTRAVELQADHIDCDLSSDAIHVAASQSSWDAAVTQVFSVRCTGTADKLTVYSSLESCQHAQMPVCAIGPDDRIHGMLANQWIERPKTKYVLIRHNDPVPCKTACMVDHECVSWTWKRSTCTHYYNIGKLTTVSSIPDMTVLEDLGFKTNHPCSQNDHAFDMCLNKCVHIRNKMHQGWCVHKWTNCKDGKYAKSYLQDEQKGKRLCAGGSHPELENDSGTNIVRTDSSSRESVYNRYGITTFDLTNAHASSRQSATFVGGRKGAYTADKCGDIGVTTIHNDNFTDWRLWSQAELNTDIDMRMSNIYGAHSWPTKTFVSMKQGSETQKDGSAYSSPAAGTKQKFADGISSAIKFPKCQVDVASTYSQQKRLYSFTRGNQCVLDVFNNIKYYTYEAMKYSNSAQRTNDAPYDLYRGTRFINTSVDGGGPHYRNIRTSGLRGIEGHTILCYDANYNLISSAVTSQCGLGMPVFFKSWIPNVKNVDFRRAQGDNSKCYMQANDLYLYGKPSVDFHKGNHVVNWYPRGTVCAELQNIQGLDIVNPEPIPGPDSRVDGVVLRAETVSALKNIPVFASSFDRFVSSCQDECVDACQGHSAIADYCKYCVIAVNNENDRLVCMLRKTCTIDTSTVVAEEYATPVAGLVAIYHDGGDIPLPEKLELDALLAADAISVDSVDAMHPHFINNAHIQNAQRAFASEGTKAQAATYTETDTTLEPLLSLQCPGGELDYESSPHQYPGRLEMKSGYGLDPTEFDVLDLPVFNRKNAWPYNDIDSCIDAAKAYLTQPDADQYEFLYYDNGSPVVIAGENTARETCEQQAIYSALNRVDPLNVHIQSKWACGLAIDLALPNTYYSFDPASEFNPAAYPYGHWYYPGSCSYHLDEGDHSPAKVWNPYKEGGNYQQVGDTPAGYNIWDIARFSQHSGRRRARSGWPSVCQPRVTCKLFRHKSTSDGLQRSAFSNNFAARFESKDPAQQALHMTVLQYGCKDKSDRLPNSWYKDYFVARNALPDIDTVAWKKFIATAPNSNNQYTELPETTSKGADVNAGNAGLKCPSGVFTGDPDSPDLTDTSKWHPLAQATVLCPSDKPVRCSKMTIVSPIGGTCEYSSESGMAQHTFSGNIRATADMDSSREQWKTKMSSNAPCHVYDFSCHSVEDDISTLVCGDETIGTKLGGVKCGEESGTGGFCGVDDAGYRLTADEVTCDQWPTNDRTVCPLGFALVWASNDQPTCMPASEAHKKDGRLRNDTEATLHVVTEGAEKPEYYYSLKCKGDDVTTASGDCVHNDCTARLEHRCEAQDLQSGDHSCTWNGTSCVQAIEVTHDASSTLWWPGFVTEDGAFGGVGPAYHASFDSCESTKSTCYGFSGCGTYSELTDSAATCMSEIKQKCCNVNNGQFTDNMDTCAAKPSAKCAGGKYLHNRPSFLPTSAPKADVGVDLECPSTLPIMLKGNKCAEVPSSVLNFNIRCSSGYRQVMYDVTTAGCALECSVDAVCKYYSYTAGVLSSCRLGQGTNGHCGSVQDHSDSFYAIAGDLVTITMPVPVKCHSTVIGDLTVCRQQLCPSSAPYPYNDLSVANPTVTGGFKSLFTFDNQTSDTSYRVNNKCCSEPPVVEAWNSKMKQVCKGTEALCLPGMYGCVSARQSDTGEVDPLCQCDEDTCKANTDLVQGTSTYSTDEPGFYSSLKELLLVQTFKDSNMPVRGKSCLSMQDRIEGTQWLNSQGSCACTVELYHFRNDTSVLYTAAGDTCDQDAQCVGKSNTHMYYSHKKAGATVQLVSTYIQYKASRQLPYMCDPISSCTYEQKKSGTHGFVVHAASTAAAYTGYKMTCRTYTYREAAQHWCMSQGSSCQGLLYNEPSAEYCLKHPEHVKSAEPGTMYQVAQLYSTPYEFNWTYGLGSLVGYRKELSFLPFEASGVLAVCAESTACQAVSWDASGEAHTYTVSDNVLESNAAYAYAVKGGNVTTGSTCAPRKDCLHGTSVVSGNTCTCRCDPFWAGEYCDKCSSSNRMRDCKTCKPNFNKGFNDICICMAGYDISTGCTQCLPGVQGAFCHVDKCTFVAKETVAAQAVELNNIVVAYNNDHVLYDGVKSAGYGLIPLSMQNTFVRQNSRVFWLYGNYSGRAEIINDLPPASYNRIIHDTSGEWLWSIPEKTISTYESTVVSGTYICSPLHPQYAIPCTEADCTTAQRKCSRDPTCLKFTTNGTHVCWSDNVVPTSTDDTVRVRSKTALFQEEVLNSYRNVITDQDTWGHVCSFAGMAEPQLKLLVSAQDVVECAQECFDTPDCDSWHWSTEKLCRYYSADHLEKLEYSGSRNIWVASEYNVDPLECVSGGLYNAGIMRNLPNKPALAVPAAHETMQEVPEWVRDRVVCAHGEAVPFILSQYRRHRWSSGVCTDHVQYTWLYSMPRGLPMDIMTIRQEWIHGKTTLLNQVTVADATECAELCVGTCTRWAYQPQKCALGDNFQLNSSGTQIVHQWGGSLDFNESMRSSRVMHGPGTAATPPRAALQAPVSSAQACCTMCDAYQAWQLAGALCSCYAGGVFDGDVNDCWDGQVAKEGETCNTRIHMKKEASKTFHASLDKCVPLAQFTVPRETHCEVACAENGGCRLATVKDLLCVLYYCDKHILTLDSETNTYVKQGGCIEDTNRRCVFRPYSVATPTGTCSASGATVAYQANARMYYGDTKQPSTIPITAGPDCQENLMPLPLTSGGKLLQTPDASLLFERFDKWPSSIGVRNQASYQVTGPTKASVATERDYVYDSTAARRRRTVPASIGIPDNNLASSFQFTQSTAISTGEGSCAEQAQLATIMSGLQHSSSQQGRCSELGCVRAHAKTSALETIQSAYVQQLEACLNATRLDDSEHPTPVVMYIQPPEGFQFKVYQGIPTYAILQDSTSSLAETSFGVEQPPPQLSATSLFVQHTPAPTPSVHNVTLDDIECTDEEHCCFKVFTSAAVSNGILEGADELGTVANTNADKCQDMCAKRLLCRVMQVMNNVCTLWSLPIHSLHELGELPVFYVGTVAYDCAPSAATQDRATVVKTATASEVRVKQDCCMHTLIDQ